MTELEIQAFLAVTRSGTFSRAAQDLYITQPALSRRISNLEDELGYRLLERHKGVRTVEPTREGRAFVPVAEHWLSVWDEARRIPQQEEKRIFRLSAIGSVSTYILNPAMRKFLDEVTCGLMFYNFHSFEAYSGMERDELDMAFVSDDRFSRTVETIPAFREPMVLVSSPDSNLPAQVHPAQLDPGREIRMQWNPEYNMWHTFWFGPSALPRCWFDQMYIMEQAIQWGNSWLIAPASVADSLTKRWLVQTHTLLEGPTDRMIYYLLGTQRKHKQTQRVLDLLRDELSRIEGVISLL